MWKCPICSNEEINEYVCKICGYDEREDFVTYRTIYPADQKHLKTYKVKNYKSEYEELKLSYKQLQYELADCYVKLKEYDKAYDLFEELSLDGYKDSKDKARYFERICRRKVERTFNYHWPD